MSDFHDAAISRDVDKIMSYYAPDVVAFDIGAPLVYSGRDSYRKSWEAAFSMEGPSADSGYEFHNLSITSSNEIAFCHYLNHCYGTMKDGNKMDMWMRSTQCFKKTNGKWFITHEQYSVPVDFETGKALLDLRPEKILN
ncbi:MAG: YybH family protein [Bacteriovorax sp.]